MQGQKSEQSFTALSFSSSPMDTGGSKTVGKNDNDLIEEDWTSVTDALQQIVGSWTGANWT